MSSPPKCSRGKEPDTGFRVPYRVSFPTSNVQRVHPIISQMFLDDNFKVTFAESILGVMAIAGIPAYLDRQFSKMYPLKGPIYRMNRLWKS